MKALVVKGPKSKLHGATCGLCPRPVRVGESVLYRDMPNDAYLERRLVFHTSCMEAVVARAPKGAALVAVEARAEQIRRAMLESGTLYPDVDVA